MAENARENLFKQLFLSLSQHLNKVAIWKEFLNENREYDSDCGILPAENPLFFTLNELKIFRKGGEFAYHPLAPRETGGRKNVPQDAAIGVVKSLIKLLREYKTDSWEQRFFLVWRFWQKQCGENALLPADSRMPMISFLLQRDLDSVLELIKQEDDQPAFLLFQLGPVQEFIANARTCRDLLSGSYMIAYLTAAAMKKLADEFLPGCVIFPNLKGQGIFDLHNKELLQSIKHGNESLWDEVKKENNLLNPTIPNRFLALVPAKRASELAAQAEQMVRDTFRQISTRCFKDFCNIFTQSGRLYEKRWQDQAENFLQITWQTLPFDKKLADDIMAADAKLSQDKHASLEHFKALSGGDDILLNWSRFFAEVSSLLASRRNTRDFKQFSDMGKEFGLQKDAITGKEEIVGDLSEWKNVLSSQKLPGQDKDDKPYGALTMIKRLWFKPHGYLEQLIESELPKEVIAGEIAGKNDNTKNKYIAVLAMDGDHMGQWISGEKTPLLADVLSPDAKEQLAGIWKEKNWDWENEKMPVTPGYHLQFSEALANFANHEAGKIVRDHKGELVYAGGDDVLAILPASKAIDCAKALSQCFQGYSSGNQWLPGPSATVSCGIAVGHCKWPLRLLVKEARNAESRAKNEYNRNALALSIFKRSGEIMHWGSKFSPNHGLKLLDNFKNASINETISGRFANALAQLLAPYQLEKVTDDKTKMELKPIIESEFHHICRQQAAKAGSTPESLGFSEYADYLNDLCNSSAQGSGAQKLSDFGTLFLAEKFLLHGEDDAGRNE